MALVMARVMARVGRNLDRDHAQEVPSPPRMRTVDQGWWGLGVLACACGAAPSPTAPRAADKASLFGDPTLVPTRDGEAARRELAESGEITQAIRATDWIDDARVDVEREDGRARVLVVGRRTAIAPADLDAQVHTIARAVCGDAMELVLTLADAPPAAPLNSPSPALPPVLVVKLRTKSPMVAAALRSISSRVITVTGRGPSASTRLMLEPVTSIFSIFASWA